MIKKLVFSILLLAVTAEGVMAQSASSPYSLFGIGIVSKRGLVYHNNMGGLGISNGKVWILNNINPALLTLNNFSTFEGSHLAKLQFRV